MFFIGLILFVIGLLTDNITKKEKVSELAHIIELMGIALMILEFIKQIF